MNNTSTSATVTLDITSEDIEALMKGRMQSIKPVCDKDTTVIVGKDLDPKARLRDLFNWDREWHQIEDLLAELREPLETSKAADRDRGAQISSLERRQAMVQLKHPVEISVDGIDKAGGTEQLQEILSARLGQLTKWEKLLWLDNFRFVVTPDVRRVIDHIDDIRGHNSFGQGRCCMLGAQSGMGKTTLLNYIVLSAKRQVMHDYNYVPIAMVDASVTNHTAKALLRRFIAEYGAAYVKSYDEEDLLNMLSIYIPRCKTTLLIVDEVQHIKQHSLRRRLLEISNMTTQVPILVASVNPEEFSADDPEIAGRWSDYIRLETYNGMRLDALLTFLELLLPFEDPSGLARRTMADGSIGPAAVIEEFSGGILRRIMYLVVDACGMAIEQGASHLSVDLLQRSANQLQLLKLDDVTFKDVQKRNGQRAS